MSRVILHAGMPKTGSSSIQNWMRSVSGRLNDRGLTIIHDGEPDRPGELAPFRSGLNVASNRFLLRYHAELRGDDDPERRAALVDELIDGVGRLADELGDVVITAEGFAVLLIAPDPHFMAGLQRLTATHEVDLAYYVRPQDSALEARWRAWGYKNGAAPSAWVPTQLADLDYWATVENVRRLAPDVGLIVRPFHPDLLDGSDAVVDFADRVLAMADLATETGGKRDNVGVPLDFANLLRDAPAALYTPADVPGRIDTGLRQVAIAELGRELDVAESEDAQRGRALLRSFAMSVFAEGNHRLERDFGWAPGFLPDGGGSPGAPDLAELDELWTPVASDTAKRYLFAAIDRLLRASGT